MGVGLMFLLGTMLVLAPSVYMALNSHFFHMLLACPRATTGDKLR